MYGHWLLMAMKVCEKCLSHFIVVDLCNFKVHDKMKIIIIKTSNREKESESESERDKDRMKNNAHQQHPSVYGMQ